VVASSASAPVTVGDLANRVRSMLLGSLSDDLTVLAADYAPGQSQVTVTFPKKNVNVGSVLSFGLNTVQVMDADASGTVFTVLPQIDGGPDTAEPAGTIVRCKPQFTNWAIFRELCNDMTGMSSPMEGLFAVNTFEAPVDWISGTYPLPLHWTTSDTPNVLRFLRARYRLWGLDAWQAVDGAEWQPEQNIVRIYGTVPGASTLEFSFAFEFGDATDMSTTLAEIGMPTNMSDIPTYGAANALAMATEGRRAQVFSQGDSRRPSEIQPGQSLGFAREWERVRQQRVNEENARLMAIYGYRQQMPVNETGGLPYGSYGAWGRPS
jgi:hypothetical protein